MNNETEQIFLLNPTESQPSTASQKLGEDSVAPQDVEDFSTVCRTCATVTEFVIPIFDGEGLQNNFAEKIHKHLPIQVSETDVLPRVVCYQCASTLLAWHELVQCCVQADAALRTRLAVAAAADSTRPTDITESKSSSKEILQNSEPEQNKFKEIADFVVRSLDPPQYAAPGRACAYCGAEHPADAYKEHLVTAHSDRLFHCDECDTYVDRKDFIHHMSLHAVEYAAKQERRSEPIGRVKKIRKRKSEAKDENENTERSRRRSTRRLGGDPDGKPDDGRKISDDASDPRENEFSDHSDTEYGFGPLPESVFEAIEDSQDGQQVNDIEVGSSSIENGLSPIENGSSPIENGPSPIENGFSPIKNGPSPIENDDIDRSGETGDVGGVDADRGPEPPGSATKPPKKSRTCPICGKVYTASSSYFYHMKHSHKRSREHECTVCGARFGTRAGLAQHGAVHSGERRYACGACGARFRARASLYMHAQTHAGAGAAGAARWACAACGRAFRWRAQLARHALRHAAERRHACGACGRAFSVRADLLRHARTHTRQPLACPRCHASFAQPRYLKVHMERKHKADGPNPASVPVPALTV